MRRPRITRVATILMSIILGVMWALVVIAGVILFRRILEEIVAALYA